MQVSFTMISPKGQTFAPIEIDHSLVDALVSDVKPSFKLAEIEKSPDPSAKFLMNYIRCGEGSYSPAGRLNAIRLMPCMLKLHEKCLLY